MIQRVVVVKLKPEFANDETRARIVQQTFDVLPQAHGVLDLDVALPSDARTEREWDVCILVRFRDMEDVETYRTDEIHRAYADVFLRPLRRSIRVWNFELAAGPGRIPS